MFKSAGKTWTLTAVHFKTDIIKLTIRNKLFFVNMEMIFHNIFEAKKNVLVENVVVQFKREYSLALTFSMPVLSFRFVHNKNTKCRYVWYTVNFIRRSNCNRFLLALRNNRQESKCPNEWVGSSIELPQTTKEKKIIRNSISKQRIGF